MDPNLFNSVSHYNEKKVLDVEGKQHSKIDLFFQRIVSRILSCFGVHFPDCEMGKVASKIHDLVKETPIQNKSIDELSDFVGGIYRLKTKFQKHDRDGAVANLTKTEKVVTGIISKKRLEASKKLFEGTVGNAATLEKGVKSTESINPNASKLFPENDFSTFEGEVYFIRKFDADLRFGNGSRLSLRADSPKQDEKDRLLQGIKETFGKSDKKVLSDDFLKVIVSLLGPNRLALSNPEEVIFLAEQGYMVGGPRDPILQHPHEYQFIPSKNPDEGTVIVKSRVVFMKDNTPVFFTMVSTFSISPNKEKTGEFNIVTKREFIPLMRD